MHVTTEIKARVVAKLVEGIALIKAHYGVSLNMPAVKYAKRGTTAGTAEIRNWTVNFNGALLMENVEDFIARTVPHELAHLAVERIYPEAHRPQRVGRRLKRDFHGADWQEVMRVLKVTDITRCHSYDTSNTKIVKSTGKRVEWKCSKCDATLLLTDAKSARLRAHPGALWHRGCRGAKLFEVKAGSSAVAAKPAAPVITKVVPTSLTLGSKIAQCWELYRFHPTGSRQQLINMFVLHAGCTDAGAATYYATCKKKYESGAR